MANQNFQNEFLAAKRALFDLLYADLNDRQRSAVYTVNGPLLVLAGAGSGKTTVLVRRIAHLIRFGNAYADETVPPFVSEEDLAAMQKAAREEDKAFAEEFLPRLAVDPVKPWQVLSITFTNKAAGEMKTRLAAFLGEETGEMIWAGTFHSICLRILRKYGDRVGLSGNFTIFDSDDTKRAVGECIKNLELDEKVFSPRAVMTLISRYKDQLLTPDDMAADGVKDYRLGKAAVVYREYANLLAQTNAVDFDDIIFKTVRLLQEDEEVRSEYQRRFRYVCIDEYQDTNKAQFELARLLSGGSGNLMVVGDDDQSIYRFRGATIENILQFDRDYENAAVVKLEQNYRSTQNILTAANGVIAHNEGRHAKKLWCAAGDGEKVTLKRLDTQVEEGRYIVNKIESMMTAGGRRYSDFAILYRMNAQSNSLEKTFAKSGLPYRILGGTRFYERKEIKDIIAYLCVVNNRRDDTRLRRIINEPKRKIGQTTIDAIANIAASEGKSMFEIMREAAKWPAIARSAAKLGEFCDLIDELERIGNEQGLPDLFEQTIERSGYKDMLLSLGITEIDRYENVRELVSNAVEYASNHEDATLSGFLEDVALVSDIDNYDSTADAVVMMTVHSAKGLEFPVVFLPGLEDGIFPGLQSKADPAEYEEERRLAYVAITRAKEKLYITHTRARMLFGRTQYNPVSEFVGEIPKEVLQDETEQRQYPTQERMRRPVPEGGISMPRRGAAPAPTAIKAQQVAFGIGESVTHPIYGRGDILSCTDMGGDRLYEIAFDSVGTKKLMASFAKLKKA